MQRLQYHAFFLQESLRGLHDMLPRRGCNRHVEDYSAGISLAERAGRLFIRPRRRRRGQKSRRASRNQQRTVLTDAG
jgi:hypothetical protein